MQTIQVESEELLTIDQVSMIVDIPVSTIRKYCSRYRDLLALKRGENNALLFSKASVQVLVKAKDLTGQGIKPAAIKRLLLTGSKSKPGNVVNGAEEVVSISDEDGYPPVGQLDQLDTINQNQVMDIQMVKRNLETHLAEIELKFIEKLSSLHFENAALKDKTSLLEEKIQERDQEYQAEKSKLEDEILLLKEYRHADQHHTSELVKKLWENEKAISEIKASQGLWATLKRWFGLSK